MTDLYFFKTTSGLPKYFREFLRYLKPILQSSFLNNVSIPLSLLLMRDMISLRFCFEIVSIEASYLNLPVGGQSDAVIAALFHKGVDSLA